MCFNRVFKDNVLIVKKTDVSALTNFLYVAAANIVKIDVVRIFESFLIIYLISEVLDKSKKCANFTFII